MIIDLQCCNYCHLSSDFFIQLSIIHDNSSSQVGDKRRLWFLANGRTHPSFMIVFVNLLLEDNRTRDENAQSRA